MRQNRHLVLQIRHSISSLRVRAPVLAHLLRRAHDLELVRERVLPVLQLLRHLLLGLLRDRSQVINSEFVHVLQQSVLVSLPHHVLHHPLSFLLPQLVVREVLRVLGLKKSVHLLLHRVVDVLHVLRRHVRHGLHQRLHAFFTFSSMSSMNLTSPQNRPLRVRRVLLRVQLLV